MRNWIKARGSQRKAATRTIEGVGAAGAPQSELSALRERSVASALAAQKEAAIARRALEEAGEARLERDEYRRVLAAAIANEKHALDDARAARSAYEAIEGRMAARIAEEVYARGIADGRARELERGRSELLARHAHEVAEARDREWAEREERRREVQRLVFELGDARATLRASEARGGGRGVDLPSRAARLRAAIALGLAVFCSLVALALFPAAVLAALSPSRAAYLTLALGLGPWALVALTAGFGLLGLGCATLAVRAPRPPSEPKSASPSEGARAAEPGASRPPTSAPAVRRP